MNRLFAMTLVAGAMLMPACSSQNETITRVNPIGGGTDVNSRFNATDAHQMAEYLINDVLNDKRGWIPNAAAQNAAAGQSDPRPLVILGNVKNDTDDSTINMEMVTNQVQEELLNSGRVRVFAARDAREELRAERFDTEFADPATVLKKANEKKARFMIMGKLLNSTQVSGDGRTKDVYYELRLEMTDIETTEKVWIRTARSRKLSER